MRIDREFHSLGDNFIGGNVGIELVTHTHNCVIHVLSIIRFVCFVCMHGTSLRSTTIENLVLYEIVLRQLIRRHDANLSDRILSLRVSDLLRFLFWITHAVFNLITTCVINTPLIIIQTICLYNVKQYQCEYRVN